MKYLKIFNNNVEYQEFKDGTDYVTPNISYITNEKTLVLKPRIPKKIATFNVTDEHLSDGISHILLYNCSNLKNIKINNVPTEPVNNQIIVSEPGVYDIEVEYITPNLDDEMFIEGVYADFGPDSGFYGKTPLVSLTKNFFDGCNNIPILAFSNITELYLPENISFYYTRAFYSSNISKIDIPNGVTTLPMNIFEQCTNLKTVTLPNTLTTIESGAFQFSGLEEINIPNSVTSIGPSVFEGCRLSGNFNIPENITTIPYCLIARTSISSITIGAQVTKIDGYAFAWMKNLSEITCLATTPPQLSYNTFTQSKSGGVLKIPSGSDYSSWFVTSGLKGLNWSIEYI